MNAVDEGISQKSDEILQKAGVVWYWCEHWKLSQAPVPRSSVLEGGGVNNSARPSYEARGVAIAASLDARSVDRDDQDVDGGRHHGASLERCACAQGH